MVFDPGQHPNPPEMWTDPTKAQKQEEVGEPLPANVEGLATQYEWIGLDPAEARKVPRTP